MSEDPIIAIRQVVECIDEGCVPGSGHVTSGWLRRASKDEVLDWVWGNLRERVINALERTRDAMSTLNPGNAAAMREALEWSLGFGYSTTDGGFHTPDAKMARNKIEAALSAPPRNCDVGTADERYRRWIHFCEQRLHKCDACPCNRPEGCTFTFEDMPYAEEGDAK